MLTELRKRLAEEWIVDFNAQKAGERAGMTGDNIRISAWQMLQDADIQEYIEQLRELQAKRTFVNADKVQSEIARLAFSDIRDYYDENGLLKTPHDLSDDAAAALAGIEVDELYEMVNGTKRFTGYSKKIKLYDKLSALDKLARRLGMFKEDNDQRNATIQLLTNDPLNDTATNDSPEENNKP